MKNTHSGRNVLIMYLIFIFLSSCDYTMTGNNDIMKESEVEIEEQIIQEVQTMELQAIKEYKKYIESGGKVYGINGSELEEVILKDTEENVMLFNQFFVLDNEIYISVVVMEPVEPDGEPSGKEYFFSQTGFLIQEELKNDFPPIPDGEYVIYKNDGLFEITKEPYMIDNELVDTSRVIKGGAPEAYLRIDGCKRTDNGMWFSVPESFATRLKGVYFLPESGNKIMVKSEGRIW